VDHDFGPGGAGEAVLPGRQNWVVGAYRSSNKAVVSVQYHLIWCPGYRRRVLVRRVKTRLKEILGPVVAEASAPWAAVRCYVEKQKWAA